MKTSQSSILTRRFAEVRSDIYKLAEALRFRPTFQQRWLFDAVMDAQYGRGPNWIAVKSGQGPGKTASSGVVGLWRTIRSYNALTVVTAPTMRQCTDVWLAELRRTLEKAEPWLKQLVQISKTKVEIAGQQDWAVKLATATREETAQGFHQENMTVICEEASGISHSIITQYKGTLSNPDALLLLIGNPNTRDSAFFDSFYGIHNARWKKITFNAEETATKCPNIVNPQRNKDLEEEFGRDSDVYRVRVLGEFPHTDPNCVISSDWVVAAYDRAKYISAIKRQKGTELPCQFGIDFARYGGDENVVFQRQGYGVINYWKQSRVDPSVAVNMAFRMQTEAYWTNARCLYVVDAGGMGQGLLHKFYGAQKKTVEFHSNGTAARGREFANKMTEAYFDLGKLLKQGYEDSSFPVYLPKDDSLLTQLSTRRYFTNKNGQLILEAKDEYVDRGFTSPDRADACVICFYEHGISSGSMSPL